MRKVYFYKITNVINLFYNKHYRKQNNSKIVTILFSVHLDLFQWAIVGPHAFNFNNID